MRDREVDVEVEKLGEVSAEFYREFIAAHSEFAHCCKMVEEQHSFDISIYVPSPTGNTDLDIHIWVFERKLITIDFCGSHYHYEVVLPILDFTYSLEFSVLEAFECIVHSHLLGYYLGAGMEWPFGLVHYEYLNDLEDDITGKHDDVTLCSWDGKVLENIDRSNCERIFTEVRSFVEALS